MESRPVNGPQGCEFPAEAQAAVHTAARHPARSTKNGHRELRTAFSIACGIKFEGLLERCSRPLLPYFTIIFSIACVDNF